MHVSMVYPSMCYQANGDEHTPCPTRESSASSDLICKESSVISKKSARMLALCLLAAAVPLLLVFNASCYDFPISSPQSSSQVKR
jgi:hypothetical protein